MKWYIDLEGGMCVSDEFQFENLGIPCPSMEFLCSWYLELNEKLVDLNEICGLTGFSLTAVILAKNPRNLKFQLRFESHYSDATSQGPESQFRNRVMRTS
jgi:hypothetical protein